MFADLSCLCDVCDVFVFFGEHEVGFAFAVGLLHPCWFGFEHVGFSLWLVVGGFGGLWGLLCVCLFGFICLVCFDLFDFFDPGFGDGDAVGDVCVVDEGYECDVGGCFVP